METRNQLYLLYDENCPLCAWYTQKFIRFGFINEEARVPYTQAVSHRVKNDDRNFLYRDGHNELTFDPELAQNKIALVNTTTNETLYGIDSLLRILVVKLPFIQTLGKFPPIHFLLELLYNFISYNRKVIAPVTACSVEGKCAPTQSYVWRIIYIVFAGMVVHFTVGFYFLHFLSEYLITNYVRDIYLFTAQFGVQFLAFKLLKQHNFYDYAGHLATTSLIGALLLLLAGFVLNLGQTLGFATELLAPLFFGVVLTAMFMIHRNRTKLLGYSKFLTLSWVIFRIAIYALVFKLF